MNDSTNSGSTAMGMGNGGGGDDPDESFDMLANMPPTPGGGGGGPIEGSFADMLGIADSCPTTPAAVAAQQGGGGGTGNPRRSPRLAAAALAGPGTGGAKGRGGGVGAGGAIGGGGMKTPYSSRRSGRRTGGQAFPERARTPGTAASNAGGDDANASFM